MVEILLFEDQRPRRTGRRLEQTIKTSFPNAVLTVVNTISGLREEMGRVSRPNRLEVFVISVGSEYRLKQLSHLQDFFEDKRTILVLPDSENRTVALGLRLLPRFIAYQNGNLADIISVIFKMTENAP
jgi:hypothetical protein